MKYTIHLTMTPFVGEQLASEDAKQLLRSLAEFTQDIDFGYVNAANRAATLVIETDEPSDLVKKVVPWCIVTGEHPDVVPVIEWKDFVKSLADIAGVSYEEVSEGLAPLGCCKPAKTLDQLKPFTPPAAGQDLLHFITWDTIEVPGVGEETVELRGTYLIERDNPTSADWYEAEINIKMRELNVSGTSEKFGRIEVSVNTDPGMESQGVVSMGTVIPDVKDGAAKKCTMFNYAKFHLPDLGITCFNKEPIELRHNITHIPPVGQGGGTGQVRIPLYDVKNPDGEPVAYLKEVRTHIGTFCNGH